MFEPTTTATTVIRRSAGMEMPKNFEVPGPYPDLARKVQAIIQGVSTRVVSRKTGLANSTVAAMLNGDRVSSDTIYRFAEGYGVGADPLLEAGGHGKRVSSLRYTPDIDDFPSAETSEDIDAAANRFADKMREEAYHFMRDILKRSSAIGKRSDLNEDTHGDAAAGIDPD